MPTEEPRAITRKTVLEKARSLIADPEHWTQGYYAQTAEGQDCATDNPRAARFCSIGAINRASLELLAHDVSAQIDYNAALLSELRETLIRRGDKDCLAAWNDAHTHTDVIALFDDAIGALQ